MSGYELSRKWFDWSFENPEKVRPIHTAIFFFAVEHCNRLGWKEKFGFPSQMTMDAIGVRKYQTYGKALNDLVVWGFIVMVEKSKNQYSANIIQLSAPTKNGIARDKALDKATIKHGSKQGQSTGQGTGQGKDSIDKPLTNNHKPITINQRKEEFKNSLRPFLDEFGKEMILDFFEYWSEHGDRDKKMRFEKEKSFGLSRRLATWLKNQKRFEKEKKVAPKKENAGIMLQRQMGLIK